MEEETSRWYTVAHSYNLVKENYWKKQHGYDRCKNLPHYCDPRGQYNKPMLCGLPLWHKVWSFNETTGAMRPLK